MSRPDAVDYDASIGRIAFLKSEVKRLETDLATARKERDEARVVVDAAKAWAAWRAGYGGMLVHETEDALFDAVAAPTPPPAEDE